MIGASKILTVSYGTFSCTLEGFDDPFNTMKAIAEYFRDLAADDRYFGAEPPTPDAAMLHRIAEREVQRRVEAKIQDNGVILRAGDYAAPPVAQPAPQPVHQAAPAPAPQSNILAEESVAAKLQRIRSAVARAAAAPAPVVQDAVYVEDEVAPPAAIVAPVAVAAVVTAFAPPPAPVAVPEPVVKVAAEPETGPEEDERTVDTLRDEWEAIEAADEAAEDAELAIAEDDLRAVFEEPALTEPQSEEPVEAQDEAPVFAEAQFEEAQEEAPSVEEIAADDALIAAFAEDTPVETQEEAYEPAADENGALLAALAEAESENPLADTAPAIEAEPESDPNLHNLLANLSSDEEDVAEEQTHDVAAVTPAEEDYEEDYEVAPVAEEAHADEVFPEDLDDGLPLTAGPNLPEWDDNAEEFYEEPVADVPAAAAEFHDEIEADEVFEELSIVSEPPPPPQLETIDTSPASEKLRRARARVIKVRRADAPADTGTTPETLSPEAEADLQRELADAGDESGKGEREGLSILAGSNDDEDVTRLLRQANTEMDVPENKRRISTLAHLKAAVAATVADLRAPNPSAGTGEPSRLERYRADLARVMRPKRTDDMPVTERPAPLVLVSEQRIDRPAERSVERPVDAAAGRIIPRRISTGNLALHEEDDSDEADAPADADADAENIFGTSKNFVEFAERLGASEMPDLLEAAAAYTACFEGRPSFSRPHLMRHVSTVTDDNDTVREDSMRSFGQLLRQGKIEKVKRGQFAITDSSYFLAEARRMTR